MFCKQEEISHWEKSQATHKNFQEILDETVFPTLLKFTGECGSRRLKDLTIFRQLLCEAIKQH